ncbi:HNH endonuclease [Rhodococcus sp. MTM3W5.2]|uniref:HNH endonuclease n=1 Tax=Rhodococcus sp. MTM3W5.2 TaxID=1805827 RepID=UPI0009FAC5B0|nr:HNH endonuclease [Rhodococcus sp. MTM3W5.2]
MRKLDKLAKPAVLNSKAQEWTDEYVRLAAAGEKNLPSRWRHKQIKEGVAEETTDRCAYCDSEMKAIHSGHVEHIDPRSIFPEKVVAWDNLTLACEQCNLSKKDYYSELVPLLNPFIDHPEDHLVFFGDLVMAKPGSDRGLISVQKLKLYRNDLITQRRRRIETVMSYIERWTNAEGQDVKSVLLEIIHEDFHSGPYKNSVKSLLVQLAVPI